MKVKDIMKHSNATETRIIDNSTQDDFKVWAVVDYVQKESIIPMGGYNKYSCIYYLPDEIKNLTVDFISPSNAHAITIYTK